MRNHRLPAAASFLVPLLFLSILPLSLLTSCARYTVLTPRWLANAKVKPGTYTVICYCDQAVDFLTTVAFLDRQGDSYSFEPQAASYTYSVSKDLPADKALKLAEQFVRSGPSYNHTEVKEIRDPAGNLLGYEVRPIYQPFVYGDNGDVLNITYFLKHEDKISVWIRLKHGIDQPRYHDATRW